MTAPASGIPRVEDDPALERAIELVRGTRDWLPPDCAALRRARAAASRKLRACRIPDDPHTDPRIHRAARAQERRGYRLQALRARIGGPSGVCLRPELTASIVRAYTQARHCPPLPWRVSSSGPVFRYEGETGSNRLREFNQVGVELLGAGGPAADAEVIALADRSLAAVSGREGTVRIGHVGLILEIMAHAGLPPEASSALVEMMSAAAAEDQGIQALDAVLDRLVGWLRSGGEADLIVPAVSTADDRGVDRLFRQLVPHVTGRRSGHEIIHRLRRKWNLSHSLSDILGRVRDQFHVLAGLHGPAREVMVRLSEKFARLAPDFGCRPG